MGHLDAFVMHLLVRIALNNKITHLHFIESKKLKHLRHSASYNILTHKIFKLRSMFAIVLQMIMWLKLTSKIHTQFYKITVANLNYFTNVLDFVAHWLCFSFMLGQKLSPFMIMNIHFSNFQFLCIVKLLKLWRHFFSFQLLLL